MPIQAPPLTEATKLHSRFLIRALLFLFALIALASYRWQTLYAAFLTNPFLNSLILGLVAFGVGFSLISMVRTWSEARNTRRAEDLVNRAGTRSTEIEDTEQLLRSTVSAPIGTFIQRVRRVVLQGDGSATLPYLLDSLAARGEDRRALVRFLAGTLVLLGLIGTFYGLLLTIGGVRDVLGGIAAEGSNEVTALLNQLRERLETPLGGMALAFSSSLFGLTSSLVLAFLELQLFHAQNDVHARVESLVVTLLLPFWQQQRRSQVNQIQSPAATPPYAAALLENTLEHLEQTAASLREQRQWQQEQFATLGHALEHLARAMEQLGTKIETQQNEHIEALRNEARIMTRLLARQENSDAPQD